MAEARDSSSQADLGDKALGPTSLLCAPSQQQCVPSQQQIDVSQGSVCSSSDGGSFECNICLELAHDPVVTLCGHLFCWPCLYRWLHLHSASQECPVCKALVKQETLIPVYGRGNPDSSDPRKKSVSELSVPQRPAGQRPEIAQPPEFHFPQQDFNVVAVPSSPVAAARPSNFRLATGFGLFPSLFSQQVHGTPDTIGFGPGYPFGWPIGWHNAHLHSHPHAAHLIPDRQQEAVYSQLFLVFLLLVALCILFI